MDDLAKLFGNEKKVKIMRLFLFNPHEAFDIDTIGERTQLHKNAVKKYVKLLEDIGLVSKTEFVDTRDNGDKAKSGWVLNNDYIHIEPLHHMLIKNEPVNDDRVIEALNEVGNLQLVIISGIFLQEWGARLDMLVVGDNIDEQSLEEQIKALESEIGKELSYANFSSDEFNYRRNVYDKLVRDVLDYPHKKILDRLELSSP
jgi:hypothetical protein